MRQRSVLQLLNAAAFGQRHDKIKVIFPGYCVQPCKYYNIILYSNILSHYRAPYNIHIYIYIIIYICSYHNIHALLIGAASLVAVQTGSKIFEHHKLTLSEENILLCCPAWLDVRQLLLRAAHDQFLEVHSPRAEAKTRVLNHLQVPLPKDRLEHTDEPKITTEYANTLNSLNSLNVHKHDDGKHQGDSSWRTAIL